MQPADPPMSTGLAEQQKHVHEGPSAPAGDAPRALESNAAARRSDYRLLLERCKQLRLLSRLDILSLGTVLLVLALVSLLPAHLATAVVVSELAFGLITIPRRCYRLDKGFEAHASQPPESSDAGLLIQEGLQVLQQLLDPSEGHAELLRSDGAWFLDWWSDSMQPSELGRSNVAEFLSYMVFSGHLGGNASDLMQQASDTFIAAVGLDVGSDHNPRATLVAHTKLPLKARYRPLTFYLLTEAVAGVSHLQLTARQGFRQAAKTLTATYYARPAAPGSPVQPPIVFLHGIGLGLAPYTAFIKRLAAQHPHRTIVAVQYRHVSMRLTTHIPTATEVADDVAAFLAAKGFTRANVIAHSYGTLVASSLAKRHSALMAGLTLIDPVCFAMFLPHLVCKTLHFDAKSSGSRTHVKSAGSPPLVRRLMKGLVLREMHCAAAMSRRLRWPEVNLWTSEVPANTRVVLGGSDNMIPVEQVHQLLTSPAAQLRGIQVTHTPDHGHGAFLFDLQLQQDIINDIAVACDDDPDDPLSLPPPLFISPTSAAATVVDGTGIGLPWLRCARLVQAPWRRRPPPSLWPPNQDEDIRPPVMPVLPKSAVSPKQGARSARSPRKPGGCRPLLLLQSLWHARKGVPWRRSGCPCDPARRPV